ncbi:MAG: type IV secretory system conjugative DNA transfer family protein, partial [Ruminococcus sp.]|nr:type IV secretory system conjugative DNA transfer family protein [Ruminococcus sp.]
MDGKELKKLASNIFAQSEFRSGVFRAAEGCEYSLDDFDTKLNNNVLIVGGSGTGKTRKIVTPNIKEAVGSYFICDPKGQLYKVWGKYLVDKGYKIRHIDFIHPDMSDGYNPMDYLKISQDIAKLASG